MLIELYEFKEELKKEIEKELSKKEKRIALKDEHSKRKPIGCGFTIHPAYGCTNKCLYCYIQDLGLPFEIKLCKLNGKQLLYALLNNKYFVPKFMFLAFGSITDPFHPLVIDKTLDFMTSLKILKNPIQFSTKYYIDENTADALKEIDKNMSCLITIVSLKKYKILEPNAPPVEKRIETVEILRKFVKPCIFLRPIIPGITTDETGDIIYLSKSLKVPIVFGEFRATKNNLERLNKFFNIFEILNRLRKYPKEREQINIYMSDIFDKIIKMSKDLNVRYFIRASCHNAWSHNTPNPALEFIKKGCVKCENNCINKLPKVKEKEIEEFLEFLGYKNIAIQVNKFYIYINQAIPTWIKIWIETVYKRKVIFV